MKAITHSILQSKKEGNVWDTNIFGKTIGDLVEEGIKTKINTKTALSSRVQNVR